MIFFPSPNDLTYIPPPAPHPPVVGIDRVCAAGLPWALRLLLINLSDGQKDHEHLSGWLAGRAGGLTHGVWVNTAASVVTSAFWLDQMGTVHWH